MTMSKQSNAIAIRDDNNCNYASIGSDEHRKREIAAECTGNQRAINDEHLISYNVMLGKSQKLLVNEGNNNNKVFTLSFVYSSPKMSRHSRNINLLDKINNIDEDCSEDDQEVYDIDDDAAENYCDSFDSDTDEYTNRFIVSSASANEEEIETAMEDGNVWKKIKEGSNSGKASIYNIFKEVSGPTGYAKRNIMKGSVKSAFFLIIDHKMIEHFPWDIRISQLDLIRYARIAHADYDNRNRPKQEDESIELHM
uniref:PiggyBac transposable element-derived protein domain-containing protein n=1 Tax=Glossina austeni TaxID=7395 RepID=A0A1A9UE39_GLOAU